EVLAKDRLLLGVRESDSRRTAYLSVRASGFTLIVRNKRLNPVLSSQTPVLASWMAYSGLSASDGGGSVAFRSERSGSGRLRGRSYFPVGLGGGGRKVSV